MGLPLLSTTMYFRYSPVSIRVSSHDSAPCRTITSSSSISVLRYALGMSVIAMSLYSCASILKVSSTNSSAAIGADASYFVNYPLFLLPYAHVITFIRPYIFYLNRIRDSKAFYLCSIVSSAVFMVAKYFQSCILYISL